MYLAWQGESSPRKVMSEKIIFPDRLRPATSERRDSTIQKPTMATTVLFLKRQEAVNTICHSSHLSPKWHYSNIRCLPSPELDLGNATLSKAGLVSEGRLSITSLCIRKSVVQGHSVRSQAKGFPRLTSLGFFCQ